jgi:hypothetical protein
MAWKAIALLAAVAASMSSNADNAAAPSTGNGLAVPLHEAIYHATVRGIPVRVGLRLEQQGNRFFLYRSWVEPRGVFSFIRREFSETSLVRTGGDGAIIPISYRKRDEVSDRNTDMRFDATAGRVQVRYREDETTSDWEPGIYDLLSLRLALSHDLARDQLKEVYRVIDDRSRVEEVNVHIAGEETISTPLGELRTLRLEYNNRARDRMYRLWIAPDKDAALVRLEQYEEGKLRGRLNIVSYRRL